MPRTRNKKTQQYKPWSQLTPEQRIKRTKAERRRQAYSSGGTVERKVARWKPKPRHHRQEQQFPGVCRALVIAGQWTVPPEERPAGWERMNLARLVDL